MYKYFNLEQDPKMAGLDNSLMLLLDKAREIAGIPFIITSGVRTLYTNQQAGGVEDSSHLKGLAADIFCENSTNQWLIVFSAKDAGFTRIGLGNEHIHLDIDPEKPQNVLFVENH